MKNLALLCAVVLLAGCTTGYKTRIGMETYTPVPQSHVAVLTQPPEDVSYKEIGLVSAHGGQGYTHIGMDIAQFTTDSMVYSKLQKAAADLGADAVIVGPAGTSFRGMTSSSQYSTGNVYLNQNGSNSYRGGYYGTTYYNPGHPVYGLDLQGIAIKYEGRRIGTRHPHLDEDDDFDQPPPQIDTFHQP